MCVCACVCVVSRQGEVGKGVEIYVNPVVSSVSLSNLFSAWITLKNAQSFRAPFPPLLIAKVTSECRRVAQGSQRRHGSRSYAMLPGSSTERLISAAPWTESSFGICCWRLQLMYFVIYGGFSQFIWAQEFLLMTPSFLSRQWCCISHLRSDCSSLKVPRSGVLFYGPQVHGHFALTWWFSANFPHPSQGKWEFLSPAMPLGDKAKFQACLYLICPTFTFMWPPVKGWIVSHPKRYLKSWPSVSQNVIFLGNRVVADVIS